MTTVPATDPFGINEHHVSDIMCQTTHAIYKTLTSTQQGSTNSTAAFHEKHVFVMLLGDASVIWHVTLHKS